MAKKGPPPKEFAQGESVVATDAMPGIPEGTTGKVVFAEGFSWIRYWVRFDNGVVRGSINRAKLARPAEWVDLQARRARGETADDTTADVGAAAGDAADADAGGGESKTVNGVTVPAFLLERSKKRREALGLG